MNLIPFYRLLGDTQPGWKGSIEFKIKEEKPVKRITSIYIVESPSCVDPLPEFAYTAVINCRDENGVRSFENIGIPENLFGVGGNLAGIVLEIVKFRTSVQEPSHQQ
jgi:hypothetical protein